MDSPGIPDEQLVVSRHDLEGDDLASARNRADHLSEMLVVLGKDDDDVAAGWLGVPI